MANRLEAEIKLLHKAANVLEGENKDRAVSFLEEYKNLLP